MSFSPILYKNQPSLLQLYSQNSKNSFPFKMRQWEPIFVKRKEQTLNLPPLRLSIIYLKNYAH